jgi:hypothetical protein
MTIPRCCTTSVTPSVSRSVPDGQREGSGEHRMRRWVAERLAILTTQPTRAAVVLDPERLLVAGELMHMGEVVCAGDWLSLRREWERSGRRRPPGEERLVIHLLDGTREPRQLPWDIEQAVVSATIAWPVAPRYRALLRELDLSERSDVLVAAASHEVRPLMVLARVFGVSLAGSSPGAELAMIARLRCLGDVPPSAWRLLGENLAGPLARALAADPPDLAPLRDAWRDWFERGNDAPHAAALQAAGPELLGLVSLGMLERERARGDGLPIWTRLAERATAPQERARFALAQRPQPWPPTTIGEWVATTAWWGQIRAELAVGVPVAADLAAEAQATADELDKAFEPWIREHYGTLLQSAAFPPATLDKVAHFLARKLGSGASTRILLIVLDGMAFAQWAQIRERLRLTVLDAHGCCALIPTLTEVSRQGLLAGETPDAFAETLDTTSKESDRWSAFWATRGVQTAYVRYHRTDGLSEEDLVDADAVVTVIVVTGIDEFMHDAKLIGDAQFAASVDIWCRHGFLRKLIADATAAGLEMWLTADHGNVEAAPCAAPSEGLRVDHAGSRVRLYSSRVLRDAAAQGGIVWDPPRYPADRAPTLFASGRGGFHRNGVRVTHGGLSFEEVIVPLVRVMS